MPARAPAASWLCRATERMLRLSAAFGLAALGSGNQYDVLFPNYVAPSECPQGCAAWADIEKDGVANMTQDAVAKLFRNGTVHPDAGSQCIMPGASPVHGEGRRMLTSDDEEDRWLWDTASKRGPNCDDATEGKCVLSAAAGPYCMCKNGEAGGEAMGYCTPPMSTPEQINLQCASKSAPSPVIGLSRSEPLLIR